MRIDPSNLNSSLLSGVKSSADSLLIDGEIIKAIVSKIDENGTITLALSDGRMITQAKALGVNLCLGESVLLQVCKNDVTTNLQIIARDDSSGNVVRDDSLANITRDDTTGVIVKNFDSPQTQKVVIQQNDGIQANADNTSDSEAIGKLAELVVKGTQVGKALKMALSVIQEFEAVDTKNSAVDVPDNKTYQENTTTSIKQNVSKGSKDIAYKQNVDTGEQKVTDQQGKVLVDKQPAANLNTINKETKQQFEGKTTETNQVENNEIIKNSKATKPTTLNKDTKGEAILIKEQGNSENTKTTSNDMFEKRDAISIIKKGFIEVNDKTKVDAKMLKQQVDTLGLRLIAVEKELISMGSQGAKLARAEVSNVITSANLNENIQQFTYIQLPVFMNQMEQTAELYVLHRNQNKPKVNGDDGITVMLSLSTQNMGRIETLIKAKNKNIQVELRGETKRVIEVIEKNAVVLSKEMENEGYNLTRLGCRLIEQPISPNNAVEVLEKAFVDGMRRLDVVI